MKSLNRIRHYFPVLAVALVLAATPAMAEPTPKDVLDLYQSWLDGTDNFLAEVYVVAVEDQGESLVSKGLLLSDQSTGSLSFQLVDICSREMAPLQVEQWAGEARAGVAAIGFSDLSSTAGPFRSGSWTVFSRDSTVDETLQRLGTIASEIKAVKGTGILEGLEGLVISLDQEFKRSTQGIVEQMLGGELMSDREWGEPQELELWFDAEDGRIHQISSIARGVRRDVLFDYAAVNLSPDELAETRESMAVRTSDPPFTSFVELMDAVMGAQSLPMHAGLPLVAGILLLLVGRALRRLS